MCSNARFPFHGLPSLDLAANENKAKAFGGQDVVMASDEARNQAQFGTCWKRACVCYRIGRHMRTQFPCAHSNYLGKVDVLATAISCFERKARVFPSRKNINN